MLFIFEAFAIFGAMSNFISMSLIQPGEAAITNPALAAMNASPEFALYTKLMAPVTLLLAVIGIITGLGLLKGREGARKAGIALGSIKVIIAIVGGWMTATYLGKAAEKMFASAGTHPITGPIDVTVPSGVKAVLTASAVGGAVFAVGLAVTMIVLLTRPSAKAFCSGQFIEPSPPPLR